MEENENKDLEKDDKNDDVATHKVDTKEFKPITSQEEFDNLLKSRLERAKRTAEADARKALEEEVRADIQADFDRKANEEKGEFKELYEEAQKTIAKLEQKLADKDTEALKISLLEEAKLPASAAKRIFGSTKEEIESDIKLYLKDLGPIAAPKEPGVTSPTKKVDSKVTSSSGQAVDDPATWGFAPLKK